MKKLAVSCRVLRSLGVGGWLLAVSVAMAADMARAAESVPYLDWDDANGKMTNATISVSDYEPVTSETREFADGKWYVVAGNVVIDNGDNIKVNGSAHLILCDDATLTVKNVGASNAAIDVSVSGSTTNSLTIYGQQGGSGVLSATGGIGGAGIGGAMEDAGGTVTINGGTVTATGGQFGAGIGGGCFANGGTVTVNGGTVTANGGTGAGIGGGDSGAGGSVTVNGGLVTAKGSSGIGGGSKGAGGTVTINGGTLTANGRTGAGIGGANGNHGTVTFGAGAWRVFASNSEPGIEVLAAAYASDHSAMYVSIEPSLKPPLSLKIPAGVHYSYVVSNETTGAVLKGVFADGTNTYAVKNGSTVKVYFTLDEDYMWDGGFDNPKDLGVIESDKVVDASEMPKTKGLLGSETNPWKVGENVTAYVSDEGVLVIGGTGAMSNFVSAADVPWAPETVKKVAVDVSKIQIGVNSLSALADGTLINETLVSNIRPYVSGFTSTPVQPVGAISPAEFERIDIVDGVAYLCVSVYTNSEVKVEGEGWGVATNGVIEVPAPGKQGFFILKSKPAAVSNRSGRPDTADIQHD